MPLSETCVTTLNPRAETKFVDDTLMYERFKKEIGFVPLYFWGQNSKIKAFEQYFHVMLYFVLCLKLCKAVLTFE